MPNNNPAILRHFYVGSWGQAPVNRWFHPLDCDNLRKTRFLTLPIYPASTTYLVKSGEAMSKYWHSRVVCASSYRQKTSTSCLFSIIVGFIHTHALTLQISTQLSQD